MEDGGRESSKASNYDTIKQFPLTEGFLSIDNGGIDVSFLPPTVLSLTAPVEEIAPSPL